MDAEEFRNSFENRIDEPGYRDAIYSYLLENRVPLENLSYLNFRVYGLLKRAGFDFLYQIFGLTRGEMMKIPGMSENIAQNISDQIREYLLSNREAVTGYLIQKSQPAVQQEKHGEKKEEECRKSGELPPVSGDSQSPSLPDRDSMERYRSEFLEYVRAKDVSLDEIGLSVRSSNCLHRQGYFFMSDIIFEDEESLYRIHNMGKRSVDEVLAAIHAYLKENQEKITAYCNGDDSVLENETEQENRDLLELSVYEFVKMPEYHDAVLQFVRENDRSISQLELSVRSKNGLRRGRYENLSDIVFETEESLGAISGMGRKSVDEIENVIKDYLHLYEKQIFAFCSGDTAGIFSREVLEQKVLDVFRGIDFSGLHYPEILEAMHLPEGVEEESVKKAIGHLIAEHQLEYVDYRCYRVYMSFEQFLTEKADIRDRDKKFAIRRLDGETLDEIAATDGITRERVRQIVKKTGEKVREQYMVQTGLTLFDEDYYQYFYTTYDVDREMCREWFGISERVFNYLGISGQRGSKNITEATNDPNIDVSLKLKISNYLNRNKIYIDGNWIEKNRTVLENAVLEKFCRDEVSFEEFGNLYNRFLEEQEVPYDPKIYFTQEVENSRYNKLAESRCVLWKLNQMLRYYDIDGQDYTDLLYTLNLDGFENTEISTLKLFQENPDLMERYDIRDQYELHNLLRKVVPEGSYHGFKCGRMPMISFGDFDRTSALFELLVNYAPISMNDFADIVCEEYGYDRGTVLATYLNPFKEYLYQGRFIIDQKIMPENQRKILKEALTEDFYYIDDIRRIYEEMIPDADLETVNPYNLKSMGFTVLSKYALQNYSSLDEYFAHLLTENEVMDITPYRKKFCYIQMWSKKLLELKNSYDILEFEPNQIIQIGRLERNGVTRQMLRDFCSEVYDYVEDGAYFSAKSLRLSGFRSDLYELGFSDWFYANVLSADERFSYNRIFNTLVFCKGKKVISVHSFICDYVRQVGSIDIYDMMNVLENEYGCQLTDRDDLMGRIKGINLYYDPILQRLYFNEELYYKELDNDTEDM